MSQDFAEFYAAHFHQIAGQLHAYLGDRGEAQDLTQEAFVRALDRWDSVRSYDHPSAWVRQVAWNLATSRLRHLQVAMRHLARERPRYVDGPEPDRVALAQALAALPPNHRMAVVLHHVAQLSTSEIAEQRGVAEGTVRSWLSRGRTQLAEQFADDEHGFTPPGAEAARATVKRRRAVRRSALAALAVVMVLALAAVVLRTVGRPEVVTPTPTETRRAALQGIDLDVAPEVAFTDALHGWLLYRQCQREVDRPCRHALGATSDGGKSWRRVNLPERPSNDPLLMYAVDARTVALLTRLDSETPGFLVSRDGGANFTWYAVGGSDIGEALELTDGRFQILCPQRGLLGCRERELVDVRTGAKVVSPWPGGTGASVTNGEDGRIWLRLAPSSGSQNLFVSSDGAGSWLEVGWPAGGKLLHLSPDGRQAWISGEGRFWELVGTQWVLRMEVDLPLAKVDPALLGDGLWLVWRDAGYWYLRDGGLTAIGELDNLGRALVLPDGSVAVTGPGGTYLGTGPGMAKRWVYLKL